MGQSGGTDINEEEPTPPQGSPGVPGVPDALHSPS